MFQNVDPPQFAMKCQKNAQKDADDLFDLPRVSEVIEICHFSRMLRNYVDILKYSPGFLSILATLFMSRLDGLFFAQFFPIET